MKAVLVVLLALSALALAVPVSLVLDDFKTAQAELDIDNITTAISESLLDIAFTGGGRDISLQLDAEAGDCTTANQASVVFGNLATSGSDTGSITFTQTNECFGDLTIQYDGTGESSTLDFLTGLDTSFLNLGNAVQLNFTAQNAVDVVIRAYTAANEVCNTTISSVGNGNLNSVVVNFSAFLGDCDFSVINALEIFVPSQIDTVVNLLSLAIVELRGAVNGTAFIDTNCNGILDLGEQALVGTEIILSPGDDCPIDQQARISFTAGANGAFNIGAVASCSYTVFTDNTVNVACGDLSKVVNVVDQIVSTVNFGFSAVTIPVPATSVVDDFTTASKGLIVNALSVVNQVYSQGVNILGGERDIIFQLADDSIACIAPLFSSASVDTSASLGGDIGVLEIDSNLACVGNVTLQYDGVDVNNPGRNYDPGLGLQGDFESLGEALRVRLFSTVQNALVTVTALNSDLSFCSFSFNTTGRIQDEIIAFTSFSGECDFTDIKVLEITFPSIANATVSLVSLVNLNTVTGRIYQDVGCDGLFNAGADTGLESIVTLTPTGLCKASPSFTVEADEDGLYAFAGVPLCTYIVSASSANLVPCTTSSKALTVSTGDENVAFFGFQVYVAPTAPESSTPGDAFSNFMSALNVNSETTIETEASLSPVFLGGARNTTTTLAAAAELTCTPPNSATADFDPLAILGDETGVFTSVNTQDCFAKTVFRYNGANDTGLGAIGNFSKTASGFRIQFSASASNGSIIVRAITSTNDICTVTIPATGSNTVQDVEIPFTDFQGSCNFTAITTFEVEIPATAGVTTRLSSFELITSVIQGRIYTNNNTCDGVYNDGVDTPSAGVEVTLTPTSNCPANVTTIKTTTDTNGTYIFAGLTPCDYTVSAGNVTGSKPCTSSTQSSSSEFGSSTSSDFAQSNVDAVVPPTETISCGKTLIDGFTVGQRILFVNDEQLVDQVSVTSNLIIGGERDVQLTLSADSIATCTDPLSSTNNVNVDGIIDSDTGIFIAANDQSCFARSVIQYDGVDGSSTRSFLPGLGSNADFNNFASAVHVRYFADLNAQIIFRALSVDGVDCSATVTTTGGNVPEERTINFTSFTGICDFSNVRVFEIEFPAIINVDVTISIVEFVTTCVSGRVFVDCACNDNYETGTDIPLENITVTLNPSSGCAVTTVRTLTTNANGRFRFAGLPACAYTISSAVANYTACSSSSKSVTTVFGNEASANFSYRPINEFKVPDAKTVLCTDSTDPASTGSATSGGTCTGDKPTTFADTITNGRCDGEYVINRRWTDGTQTGTQVITVSDTKIGPSISCPANFQAGCAQSLKPAITGRPTVDDDCTNDIDVTYTGTDTQGTCDGALCSRNTVVLRKFVARDDCGNTGGDCTQTITVVPCLVATTCPQPANCHNSSILYRDNVITDL